MSAVENLLWLAVAWAVFFAFAAVDLPALLGRAANHFRRQRPPHWARHGHVPPADDPPPHHGRHARNSATSKDNA
ncbi:hypothetical protein ACFVGN_05740 [Streptomyces sp. NPDC057757]|uniref:hypothetical protein n=1 Tax=Streptomyces sp. NPDC057757 TaxID=3346241 RepID=UPI0036BF81B4